MTPGIYHENPVFIIDFDTSRMEKQLLRQKALDLGPLLSHALGV
jgi:hypothetical protein